MINFNNSILLEMNVEQYANTYGLAEKINWTITVGLALASYHNGFQRANEV